MTESLKGKKVFALVKKGRLAVISGQLPIFWNKSVAAERNKDLGYKYEIVPVSGEALIKLITKFIV